MLFLTTAAADDAQAATPLGSFVYAMPDRFNRNTPLSTALYTVEPTLEFTSRLAKLLAKKTQLPVYVGNSVSLASTGLGGTVDEELAVFKAVVDVILPKLRGVIKVSETAPNGISSS